MSARHAHAHGDSAHEHDRITLCPNCGSEDHRSNFIDIAPYRDLARCAKLLRALGHDDAADDALLRYARVKIINHLRRDYPYRCESCGVAFDG